MLVILITFCRLCNYYEVVELGEISVVCAGTGHVDKTFLEADNLTCGNDCHAAKYMGLAAADGVDLGDDAGELTSLALNLYTGFNYVLNGSNTNAFARFCDIEAEVLDPGLDVVIFVHEGLDDFGIDIQSTVLYFAFL